MKDLGMILKKLLKNLGEGKNIFVVTGVCMKRLEKPDYNYPPKFFWKLICIIVQEVSVVSFYKDND